MKSQTKETPYGTIQIENGVIKSFKPNVLGIPNLILKIGDPIVSNGRIFTAAGTKGVIEEFREPDNGCTNNVIGVRWENHQSKCVDWMKTKDLNLNSFIKTPLHK